LADELLVCSNRGPLTYEGTVASPVGRRGGGGLIGAVSGAFSARGGTWIAAPLSNVDRQLARKHPAGREQDGVNVRFLDLGKELHHLHYEVVSNEVLWFLFHYLFDVPHSPTFDGAFPKAWDAYREVNDLYAQALVGSRGEVVLIQDYHLMLVAAAVRRRTRSRRPLVYFHHIPWCEPEYFSMLPQAIGVEILEGMLAHDVVGFHAKRWADAFVHCCERYVRGASVTHDEVTWKRRRTKIIVAPVPIDETRLRADADDPATRSWVESHDALREGRRLLLRVDRIDLSKNPLRGFLAFEHLLERRPGLVDEVLFMAMLYPSRTTVERYQAYYAECLGVVRRVNERFGPKVGAEVGPIHMLFEDDFHRSLGAMRLFDALLVNPVFDGLNLVSKEAAVLNERDGSVILSTNAGAFDELGSAVVPVDPFDVPATADAIEAALDASPGERKARAKKLRTLATKTTPADWIAKQLRAAGL
jgi:trehalose 6-phosphate synthase